MKGIEEEVKKGEGEEEVGVNRCSHTKTHTAVDHSKSSKVQSHSE